MLFAFRTRIAESWTHAIDGSSQQAMFLIFILLSVTMSALTFLRRYSLIPVLGVLSCCYLMIEIPAKSWMVFFGWMAVGLTVYFGYGRQKSRLAGH
jgi:hypothetical protein